MKHACCTQLITSNLKMVVELAIGGLTALVQPTLIVLLYWALEAIPTIFSIWGKGDRKQDEADFSNIFIDKKGQPKTYDFIVVGGGSSGAVVANRLSRNLYSVLLLEAGGEPMPLQYVPQTQLLMLNYPETDWMHRTVSQKRACLNSVNAQSSWSAGKVLGGSGTINGMIHLRGHKLDYDNWANLTGDPSWSWEGVLPFFKQYEDYEVPGDPENHGYGGDLRIELSDHLGVAPEFIKAGMEIGYPHVDVNAPYNGAGFDYIRYPMRHGRRIATYKAFIEPLKYLPTLTIMKFSHVNKILFKEGNTAYGVQFDRHGVPMTAYASKEVIICAGTMGSPKLLMLSGVGPREHLEELNIPVISDLPVGQNLQDHLAVYLSPFFINQPRSVSLERDVTPSSFVKWFTLGKGPLSNAGCTVTGLFTSEYAKARGETNWPDIHIFVAEYALFRTAAKSNAHAYNLKVDEIIKYYENAINKDALHVLVSGARPFSRGYLKLGGNSPYDKPIIDPNYLGDASNVDFKVLLEAVKKTMYLMENTTAMGVNLGTRFTTESLPGCEHYVFRSDPYWECYIRRYSVTLHHPVGTAAMGTVVDTNLKVLGTRSLRIIDSSIQSVIITTNTQASSIMIGYKGVDMVMKFWRKVKKGKRGYQNDVGKTPL